MLTRMWAIAVAFVALMLPLNARAQVLFAGTEFQVNTYTSSDQDEPAICRAADGNFVVVWESGGNHDGDSYGIFAQRYASTGEESGTEFQVNTYTTESQDHPAICCDDQGNFVVVWESFYQDGFDDGIFGQRFASDGSFRGTEFQVNTHTSDDESSADVCCDAVGNFTVVWDGRFDGDYGGVFGQRFASNGAFRGTEFQVNTYTPGYQQDPAVCCDASGDFVVVWESTDMQDGDVGGVFGQRFASTGAVRGLEFQVNTYTSGDQQRADVCCDVAGNFAVVWDSLQDGDNYGVFGQRFESNGAPRGVEFQVNTYTTRDQDNPSICCDANGDFVVAWESLDPDGDQEGVFARRFTRGVFSSSEFQVNTYTTGDQDSPAVACDAEGNFVIVWDGDDKDGDHGGVFGQRFELLALVPTPALSFGGILIGVVALLGAGIRSLRRRRGQ